MNALLLRYLPHAAVLLAAAVGVFWYGQSRFDAGEAKVWALWEKERRIVERTYDQKVIEAARIEDEYELTRWRLNDEIKTRLAADRRADDLARRLSEHYAARRSVPEAPDTSADPFGTGGVGADPGEVDAALTAYLAACSRDAIRLNGWIEWWRDVSK